MGRGQLGGGRVGRPRPAGARLHGHVGCSRRQLNRAERARPVRRADGFPGADHGGRSRMAARHVYLSLAASGVRCGRLLWGRCSPSPGGDESSRHLEPQLSGSALREWGPGAIFRTRGRREGGGVVRPVTAATGAAGSSWSYIRVGSSVTDCCSRWGWRNPLAVEYRSLPSPPE